MSVVNFVITQPLEKQVNQMIKERGFMSKAEFFRMAVLNFIQSLKKSSIDIDKQYDQTMQKLSGALEKKFQNKKLPPLEEQLADLR